MSGLVPQFSPAIGSAFLLSIGYIDIGKWVAAIEGGFCFGRSLVLLLVFCNCSAVLCQYLVNWICLVTGKNLAQICCEEYPRSTCILLGSFAELSMILSDLTKILGVAHGFSQLFELDLFTCICFSASATIVIPLFFSPLGLYKSNVLYISAFTVVFYAIGVLLSQPQAAFTIDNRYCYLNLENSCTIMAILGAHMIPHTFYTHSSIAQQNRRQLNFSMDTTIQIHLVATVFLFSAIFLVNYAITSSAASVFNNYDFLPSFEDAFLVMDQILKNSAAPFPLSLFFFFSSLITALNYCTQVVLQDFFLLNLPIWLHHIIARALAIIPALYWTHIAGPEGIYQLLLFCQVISAILLPPCVVPLFQVASSRLIMGAFRISSHVEIFALGVFSGMLTFTFIFTTLLLYGNNEREALGWFYALFLLLTFVSLSSMIFLLVRPLGSSVNVSCIELGMLKLNKKHTEQSDSRQENEPINISDHEHHKSEASLVPQNLLDSHSSSITEPSVVGPGTLVTANQDTQEYDQVPGTTSYISQTVCSVVNDVLDDKSDDIIIMQISRLLESGEEYVTLGTDLLPRDEQLVGSSDPPESCTISTDLLPQDEQLVGSSDPPESCTISVSKVNGSKKTMVDGKNISNDSLEATSGLGTGRRKRLAAILDEFWGLLFDFHGKQTKEAKGIIAASLLDLDFESSPTFSIADSGKASGQNSPLILEVHPIASTECHSSPLSQSVHIAESPRVFSAGAPVCSSTLQQPIEPYYDTVCGAKGNVGSLKPSLSPSGTFFTNNEDPDICSLSQNGSASSLGSGLEDVVSFCSDGRSNHLDGCENTQDPDAMKKDTFKPMHVSLYYDTTWTTDYCPVTTALTWGPTASLTWGGKKIYSRSGSKKKSVSYGEGEYLLLRSLRLCIRQLLSLKGSDWLFNQEGGADEKLIDYLAKTENLLFEDDPCKVSEAHMNESGEPIIILPSKVSPRKGCIWQAGLVVCFGVWCIRRIMELVLVESRPELWGKYTFILNRLQGILGPAFCKQRRFTILPCERLQLQAPDSSSGTRDIPVGVPRTSASYILQLTKRAEKEISGRKGGTYTTTSRSAYRTGRMNLGSVLKRYRRRLSKSST